MIPFTDIHSHILPGVDDGAETMEETMAVLKEAKRQGISRMIVTPHYHPGRYQVTAEQIHETLAEVQKEAARRQIDIKLYPGQECYYYSELVEQLDAGNALTLAGSRYVLVEFSVNCAYSKLTSGLLELQQNGYIPIVAHFERYECLWNDERLADLKQRGILLQMNMDRLLKNDHLFSKNIWKSRLLDGIVDYLGSDCHGTHFRPLKLEKSMAWIEKNVSSTMQRRILQSNIRNIL